MSIRVGTSGWHYPTGRGTWNGIFYPPKRPRGFDELAWYARYFDTVEINATFYRQPDPVLCRRWLERTPGGFTFAVKLFQKFTHPDMFVEKHHTEWDVSRGDLDQFRLGIDPIAAAGRMAALLVQFPPSFQAAEETRAYLDWLLRALGSYPLAVELRHRSWSDAPDATSALLDAHRAAWVLIDEPKFRSSIRQELHRPTTDLVGRLLPGRPSQAPLCYLRLHGRNAAQWWTHERAEDRYDYLYTATELAPFAEAAREAESEGRTVVMYLNNHFSAKAVANAAILRHQLGDPVADTFPREMVSRYPELGGIVQTDGLPL